MTPAALPQNDVIGLLTCGFRSAAEALHAMSGRPIRLTEPEVRRCRPDELLALAGGDQVAVGVYVGFQGPWRGDTLLVLSPDRARSLAGIVLEGIAPTAAAADPLTLGPLAVSALEEVANVTVAALVGRLADELCAELSPTVPAAFVEPVASMLETIRGSAEESEILVAHGRFHDDCRDVEAMLLVLPHCAN